MTKQSGKLSILLICQKNSFKFYSFLFKKKHLKCFYFTPKFTFLFLFQQDTLSFKFHKEKSSVLCHLSPANLEYRGGGELETAVVFPGLG